ncbi:MAG: FAD-dependent oxidoreductase, partial [Betaproteobacteria bacterium]|nr:FAD-dependent oxidoreductase [Betaproteobacteria bacterium]
YRKEIVPGLQTLAEAVHAEGALLIAQLNHGGRQHHASEIPTLWAPSAIACPHSGGVPHAMTRAEIAEVVAGFATAALNAKLGGLDGVEIHGAQGHLIQQFVSPFSNQREDEYGGSLENRLRFAKEIIAAVRAQAGADFIVGYRMGVDEFTPGGITVEESKLAAIQLAALGSVDYLSLAQGNFNTLDTHLPDSHYPPVTYAGLHAQVKAVVPGMPVVTSSRIQTPEQAEAILGAGQADIIGMCRALIADPEWPQKALRGQSGDIRRCICCNRCWSGIVASKRLACAVNPTLGFEIEMPALTRAERPKRVVVIGGGPGGLEAARTAAGRGHRVTLFEKGKSLGGKLGIARHYLPYHESSYAIDYLARQVAALGVDVRTATEGTRERVLAEQPDAVIVATGARVLTARQGCRVLYVTRFLEPLRELPEATRISTLRALDELGVVLRPNMFVDRTENGEVVLRHYYNSKREERLKDVGGIVWVGAQRANDALAYELRDAGLAAVHIIGDAYAPRRLGNAIAEGHRAARGL